MRAKSTNTTATQLGKAFKQLKPAIRCIFHNQFTYVVLYKDRGGKKKRKAYR